MELFIPSLGLILIALLFVYFYMPSMAVPLMITAAMVVGAFAAYAHWKQFGVSEYERATWMYNLRKYASYVLIALVILGAYGFYTMNFSSSSSMATPALPAITVPTMGGGVQSILKTASSRINELVRRGRMD